MSKDSQERLARQWAESCQPYTLTSTALAARDYILATTSPPTMADVEWDVDEMPGTGALTKHGRLWIMRDDAGDAIECISPDLEELASVAKKGLTPNGKRYELVEISDEPEHPETLETLEDYENAPQGTIVALADSPPWSKTPSGGWRQAGDYRTSPEMVGVKRKMLRWGWGE